MTHLPAPQPSSPTNAHAPRLRRRRFRHDEGVSRGGYGLGIVLIGIVVAVVWNYLGALWAEQLVENEVCKVFESCDEGDNTEP